MANCNTIIKLCACFRSKKMRAQFSKVRAHLGACFRSNKMRAQFTKSCARINKVCTRFSKLCARFAIFFHDLARAP